MEGLSQIRGLLGLSNARIREVKGHVIESQRFKLHVENSQAPYSFIPKLPSFRLEHYDVKPESIWNALLDPVIKNHMLTDGY